MAIACGAGMQTAADILGHFDVGLTRRVCQHTPQKLAASAAEMVAELRRRAVGRIPAGR